MKRKKEVGKESMNPRCLTDSPLSIPNLFSFQSETNAHNFDDSERLLCGIVYFSEQVCHTLFGLATLPPFDNCTYLGIDDGGEPLFLDLFADVVASFLPDTQASFEVSGRSH